jgi:hypothetical protein
MTLVYIFTPFLPWRLSDIRMETNGEKQQHFYLLFFVVVQNVRLVRRLLHLGGDEMHHERMWKEMRKTKKKEPKDSTSSAPLGTSQEPQLRATTTRRATKSIFRCKTRWAPTNLIRLCSQPNISPKVRLSVRPFHYKKNTETKRQHNYKEEE